MIVRPATPADIAAICADLRPADAREVFATRWGDDPAELAGELAALLPRAVLAQALCGTDGAAIALVGFWMAGPGFGSASLIATRRWGEIAPTAHRHCRRVVMARAAPAAFRRLECRSLADHGAAHRWLRSLGFAEEARLRALGRDGEDFVQFAWLNPAFTSWEL